MRPHPVVVAHVWPPHGWIWPMGGQISMTAAGTTIFFFLKIVDLSRPYNRTAQIKIWFFLNNRFGSFCNRMARSTLEAEKNFYPRHITTPLFLSLSLYIHSTTIFIIIIICNVFSLSPHKWLILDFQIKAQNKFLKITLINMPSLSILSIVWHPLYFNHHSKDGNLFLASPPNFEADITMIYRIIIVQSQPIMTASYYCFVYVVVCF